jgi:hypothetical protein
MTLTATVGQQLGNSAPRTALGKAVVSCTTKVAAHYSIPVASTSTPGLSDGPAGVSVLATGCDSLGCAKATVNGDVQLVKKLK